MDNVKIGTPSKIEVLLHYHCFPYAHPQWDAPAIRDATRWFLELGALKFVEYDHTGHRPLYHTTVLGQAWVEALCHTPIPDCLGIYNNDDVYEHNNRISKDEQDPRDFWLERAHLNLLEKLAFANDSDQAKDLADALSDLEHVRISRLSFPNE